MRQPNNKSKIIIHKSIRRAFSLAEVLVVVALIVLVISVVVPAMGRARDQANLVACRANLRSLVLACLMYAGDNDSFLPSEATLDNPHTGLIRMLDKQGGAEPMEIYYCPSELSPERRCSQENFAAGNIGYFYYSFTERPTSRDLSNFLRKTIQWPRVLRTTMPGDTWAASDSWFSNAPTAHRYYKKGVNYVTLGGAVEMVQESPRERFR